MELWKPEISASGKVIVESLMLIKPVIPSQINDGHYVWYNSTNLNCYNFAVSIHPVFYPVYPSFCVRYSCLNSLMKFDVMFERSPSYAVAQLWMLPFKEFYFNLCIIKVAFKNQNGVATNCNLIGGGLCAVVTLKGLLFWTQAPHWATPKPSGLSFMDKSALWLVLNMWNWDTQHPSLVYLNCK